VFRFNLFHLQSPRESVTGHRAHRQHPGGRPEGLTERAVQVDERGPDDVCIAGEGQRVCDRSLAAQATGVG